MIKLSAIVLSSFSCLVGFSQGGVVKMFRDNPAHLEQSSSGNDLVFDTRSWKFDAGSPVRSTPLIIGDNIYFGTTGGQVYASSTAGDSWKPIVRDLPAVLSVEVQALR